MNNLTLVREYTPNVIEPSFGIGRILYALLEHSFSTRKSDINRAVLSFPPSVAPTKCLIVPLSNNMQFNPVLKKVAAALRQRGMSSKIDDSATSIGRRYARNDELGTPFAVTVDFQTLEDDTITLRERDSTRQIRQSFTVIVDLITDLVEERICWADVLAKYPLLEGTLED